jgi:hypothetical protein
MADQVQNTAPAAQQTQNTTQQSTETTQSSDNSLETSGNTSAGEQVQELAETLNDPNASKAEKAQAKKELKKLKLKIDGREKEISFDPNDDEYLTRQFQMAEMGQKRAQEKAVLEKEVMRFIEDLKKNPKKALSDPAIGLDLKELARQVIEEEIENSKKSPEQIEKEKLELELKNIKEQYEKEKEEARQRDFERLKEQEYERYDILMSQALEKTDLPKSPYIVKKIADYMLLGLEAGKDVTPEDVLPLVREEMQEDLKQMFSVMPDEVVQKIVGKDVITRIRKNDVAKIKKANTTQATKQAIKNAITDNKDKGSKKGEKKQLTFKDFFKV